MIPARKKDKELDALTIVFNNGACLRVTITLEQEFW